MEHRIPLRVCLCGTKVQIDEGVSEVKSLESPFFYYCSHGSISSRARKADTYSHSAQWEQAPRSSALRSGSRATGPQPVQSPPQKSGGARPCVVLVPWLVLIRLAKLGQRADARRTPRTGPQPKPAHRPRRVQLTRAPPSLHGGGRRQRRFEVSRSVYNNCLACAAHAQTEPK